MNWISFEWNFKMIEKIGEEIIDFEKSLNKRWKIFWINLEKSLKYVICIVKIGVCLCVQSLFIWQQTGASVLTDQGGLDVLFMNASNFDYLIFEVHTFHNWQVCLGNSFLEPAYFIKISLSNLDHTNLEFSRIQMEI